MKILVLGELHSEQLARVLSRRGHRVSAQKRVSHMLVTQALASQKPDLVVVADDVRPESLKLLEAENYKHTGNSIWSVALRNEKYQESFLAMLETHGFATGKVENEEPLHIEGWWNGLDFTMMWMYEEARRLMNDGRGPEIESAWTIGAPLGTGSKLAKETLLALREILTSVRHNGPVGLDVYMSDGKLRVGRVYAEIKYDFFYALAEIVLDLVALVSNEAVKPRRLHVGSVHVSLPPFPVLNNECAQVEGVCRENEGHVAFDAEQPALGAVTARGIDVVETGRRIYRTLNHLGPADLQYRTDFGVGWTTRLKFLHSNGLL